MCRCNRLFRPVLGRVHRTGFPPAGENDGGEGLCIFVNSMVRVSRLTDGTGLDSRGGHENDGGEGENDGGEGENDGGEGENDGGEGENDGGEGENDGGEGENDGGGHENDGGEGDAVHAVCVLPLLSRVSFLSPSFSGLARESRPSFSVPCVFLPPS